MMISQFSKYEMARILGARALQISMNAPLLIKIDKEDLEKVNYDALKIAEIELNSEILPISVNRPYPKRKDEKLKRAKSANMSEKGIQSRESLEESEIAESGEIMELATPEDEMEEDSGESESE
jgi:DNA-directed RNA polymerase subunit K